MFAFAFLLDSLDAPSAVLADALLRLRRRVISFCSEEVQALRFAKIHRLTLLPLQRLLVLVLRNIAAAHSNLARGLGKVAVELCSSAAIARKVAQALCKVAAARCNLAATPCRTAQALCNLA